MLKINKENNSIVVEGLDNAQYPHDGNLVFPLNSLMMVLDESDIVTFRSAANADTVFGGNINEIEIGGSAVDKDSIVAAWEAVANASQGGGSGEGTVKSVNGVEPDENGNVEIEPELSKSVELVVLDDTGFTVETAQYFVNDLPPVDSWNVFTGQSNGLPYNVNYFITSDDTKTLKASFGDGENPMGYSFKVSTKLFVDVDGETKVVDYETPIGAGFNFMKKIADLYPFGEQYEPQLLMIKQDIYDADGNLLYISYNDASEYTHLWEKETVISTDVDGQTVQLATKDEVILNGRNDGAVVIAVKGDEEGTNVIDITVGNTNGFSNGVWVDNQIANIYAADNESSSYVDVYPDHIELYTDTPEGNTHLTVEKDGAYISNDGGETKKRVLTEDDLAGINELLENLLN